MKLRLLVIIAVVLGSLWALVPTLAPELGLPLLPDSRLHLGTHFMGGIEMTLDVDTETAVRREEEECQRFLAVNSGLGLRDEGQRLLIESELPREEVLLMVSACGGLYEPVSSQGDVHHFAISESRQQDIREREMAKVMRTMKERSGAACRDEITMERTGPTLIHLSWPGDLDVWYRDACPGT